MDTSEVNNPFEIPEHEKRLDDLFCKAFETNHSAMHDWVRIKSELKYCRAILKEQKEKYPTHWDWI